MVWGEGFRVPGKAKKKILRGGVQRHRGHREEKKAPVHELGELVLGLWGAG